MCKIPNLSVSESGVFFQALNMHHNSAPDPDGGAYDAPSDPLVSWGVGYPLPPYLPPRRLRRLDLGA